MSEFKYRIKPNVEGWLFQEYIKAQWVTVAMTSTYSEAVLIYNRLSEPTTYLR